MKNKLVTLLICLTAFASSVRAQNKPAATPTPKQEAAKFAGRKLTAKDYETLLAKLKGGDLNIDFKTFRFAFPETAGYSARGVNKEIFNKMYTALGEKKYKDTISKAQTILETDYVDLDAHLLLHISHRELGNTKGSEFHGAVLKGLAQSILKSGDGKTTATAYHVIRVDEEYAILRLLGMSRAKQELVKENGHHYDKMEITDDKTKQTSTIYFNVDKAFESYNKTLVK